MKLLVRLYKDMPLDSKSDGIPDGWPAEVVEVDDSTSDPKDGRLFLSAAELESYKVDIQAEYDVWALQSKLPQLKGGKFDTIDARTSKLISEGFSYLSKQFSLSAMAQSTWTGLYAIKDEPALVYPVKANTIDDNDFLEIKDSDEVRVFYMTAVATYRAHLDSGTALKDKVRVASTIDEVNAIEDNR